MTEKPIWLLFGVPIDETEFVDRLNPRGDYGTSDFLAEYAEYDACEAADERASAILADYARRYLPTVARPFQKLVAEAQEQCTVVRRATLDDIRQAGRRAEVIILVSHWKGPEFANRDALVDLEAAFFSALPGWPGWLGWWLRKHHMPPWYLRALKKKISVRELLRRALLAPLEDRSIETGADAFVELPATTAARRRDEIDRILINAVRPGNRLELFDGLHSCSTVAGALDGFAGVLDIAICTSTYLGDWITQASGQRIRTVQFLTVQEPNDVSARLIAVLDLLASCSSYLTARHAVARLFKDVIDAVGAKEESAEWAA